MILLVVPSNYVKEHITDSILATTMLIRMSFFTSEYCLQITRAGQQANSHAYLAGAPYHLGRWSPGGF